MIVKDFDDMRIGTIPLSKLYYGHDLIWKREDEGLIIITTETTIFTVPRMDDSSVIGTIDWGDGQTDGYNSDISITHNYLDLKSWTIKINAPIEILGNKAFYSYSNLISIMIPNSVTSIESFAFSNCTSLTSVTIPNSVISVKSWAFEFCTSLTSVTIPNSVTSIGWYTFSNCTSLTSVTISNSVTSIGSRAFEFCTSLTSIMVDENNEYYSDIDGVLLNEDKTTLIQYPIGRTSKEYAIPNSVTSIGESAFSNCTSLTSVTISNSVTNIGWYTFSNCTSLTSVTIPDSVKNIEAYVFIGCSSLVSITIPISVKSIGNHALRNTGLTSVTIAQDCKYYSNTFPSGCVVNRY